MLRSEHMYDGMIPCGESSLQLYTSIFKESWLNHNGIFRVGDITYQAMYDIAQCNEPDKAKYKCRRLLKDYVEEHYPDMVLESFIDLSDKEAKAIHPNLKWGMWIKLLPKSIGIDMVGYADIPLEDVLKRLTND